MFHNKRLYLVIHKINYLASLKHSLYLLKLTDTQKYNILKNQ